MSHTSTIKDVVFADIDALKAAIHELRSNGISCEMLENALPRAYYQNQDGMNTVAPYVLKLTDSPYDVGFYPTEGGLEARCDLYGGHIQKVLGVAVKAGPNESRERAAMGKLYNLYAVHATTRAAIRKGFKVNRINNTDGSVQLRIAA